MEEVTIKEAKAALAAVTSEEVAAKINDLIRTHLAAIAKWPEHYHDLLVIDKLPVGGPPPYASNKRGQP